MKDANDTTNSESSLSRRAVLTSLAAAAVLSGCKSTPGTPPAATPSGNANKSGSGGGDMSAPSKAALALWLIFTTRPDFASISVTSGSTKVTLKGNLKKTLPLDLSALPGKPDETIAALIAYLESQAVSGKYGLVDSTGSPVALPYAVALQAVQELFQKFGEGLSKDYQAPYTGSCCPQNIWDILTSATTTPMTKNEDYNVCP